MSEKVLVTVAQLRSSVSELGAAAEHDETAGFADVRPSQIVSWVGGYEKYSKIKRSGPDFRRAIEAATAAWNIESRDSLLI